MSSNKTQSTQEITNWGDVMETPRGNDDKDRRRRSRSRTPSRSRSRSRTPSRSRTRTPSRSRSRRTESVRPNKNQMELLFRVDNRMLDRIEDRDRSGYCYGYEFIEKEFSRIFRARINIKTTPIDDGHTTLVCVYCRNFLPSGGFEFLQEKFGKRERRERRERREHRKPRKAKRTYDQEKDKRESQIMEISEDEEQYIPFLIGKHRANLKRIAAKYQGKGVYIQHPKRDDEKKQFKVLANDEETVFLIIDELKKSLSAAMENE